MKYVKAVHVNDPDTLLDKITFKSIILEAQEEYHSLFYSNQWSRNVSKNDEPTLPAS